MGCIYRLSSSYNIYKFFFWDEEVSLLSTTNPWAQLMLLNMILPRHIVFYCGQFLSLLVDILFDKFGRNCYAKYNQILGNIMSYYWISFSVILWMVFLILP